MNDFTKRLRDLRVYLELSQVRMATLGDVSQQLYSLYERGEVTPTIPFVASLHMSTGVNLNWLIAGKGDMFVVLDEEAERNKALLQELRRLLS